MSDITNVGPGLFMPHLAEIPVVEQDVGAVQECIIEHQHLDEGVDQENVGVEQGVENHVDGEGSEP